MATKVTMPKLGESVTEGTISKWLVKKGEKVKKYEPLCEVVTDKVNAEVPSYFTGTVIDIVVQEDQSIEVGGLICYIEEEGAETSSGDTESGNASGSVLASHVQEEATGQEMKHRYSPAVLKLAQENQINLETVKGTGRGGRITRKDILASIASGNGSSQETTLSSDAAQTQEEKSESAPTPVVDVPSAPPTTIAQLSLSPGDVEIPVTGVRKSIAKKMMQSKHEAPHAWTMVEVDVTHLVAYRNQIKDEFKKKEGINLTFFPFFIKATVEALRDYPIINSHWAGEKIIQKKDINMAIAVATDDALFTPVIRNADEKNIMGLARLVNELAVKTRTGKLTLDDLQGATFTINNPGSFGSIQSAPIINYPQAAILNVEAIVKRPVIIDGMIAVRDMVNLCMSLDHRVLDGLVCGRFLQSIKKRLEAMGEGISLY